MTFATTDGSYLAKVHVDIADNRGKPLLSVDCDAPMLLVDLPRGDRYRILAQTGGASLSRSAFSWEASSDGLRVVRLSPSQALYHLDAELALVAQIDTATQDAPYLIPSGHHLVAGHYVLRFDA